MRITLGFSPCPNDTFIFHGLISGLLPWPGHEIQPVLQDVETLNTMAFDQVLDVTKLSFYAWLKVREHYRLLQSGAALGYGCGPVVIAKKPLTAEEAARNRVALPGQWTSAHLLFRLWAPKAENRVFVPYDRIFKLLASDQVDCGVIIHESRFTFVRQGFQAVVDLGAWWEGRTGLPVPLGCIAAHKRLPRQVINELEALIRRSIILAREQPTDAMPYIRAYAREMAPEVLEAHIRTFVNEFSLDIGSKGRAAFSALEQQACQAGIMP